MTTRNNEFYIAAIRAHAPDFKNIRRPENPGCTSSVFLVDTNDETRVYRFKDNNVLFRNMKITRVLQDYKIPVPDSRLFYYCGAACEIYKYNPDLTLADKIANGMSESDIFNIYCDVLRIQYEIGKIPLSKFSPAVRKTLGYTKVLKSTMKQLNMPMAELAAVVFHPLACMSNQQLFHTDFHPGNILVDKNGRVSQILDIDAVATCNETWGLTRLLHSYPLTNHDQLLDYYEKLTGHKTNRLLIKGSFPLMRFSKNVFHKMKSVYTYAMNTIPQSQKIKD